MKLTFEYGRHALMENPLRQLPFLGHLPKLMPFWGHLYRERPTPGHAWNATCEATLDLGKLRVALEWEKDVRQHEWNASARRYIKRG